MGPVNGIKDLNGNAMSTASVNESNNDTDF